MCKLSFLIALNILIQPRCVYLPSSYARKIGDLLSCPFAKVNSFCGVNQREIQPDMLILTLL